MLTVIVTKMTIKGRSVCSANRYCDDNGNNGGGLHAVLTVIVTNFPIIVIIVAITVSTAHRPPRYCNYFHNNC